MNKGVITRVVFFIYICFAIMMAGCGMRNPVEVSELAENDNVKKYFYLQGHLHVNSVDMIERRTSGDKKTDILYCRIVSENDKMKRIGEYEIRSNYCDEDGWTVDFISELSCRLETIAGSGD